MTPRKDEKRRKKAVAPANLAARSLRLGQFRPKVIDKDPKGYTRKLKHKPDPLPPPEESGD